MGIKFYEEVRSITNEFALSTEDMLHGWNTNIAERINKFLTKFLPKGCMYMLMIENKFTGTLPTSLGLMTDLFAIAVARNNIEGTIPSQLGNLVNTTRLFVSQNKIKGHVPSELGRLSNLQDLWLEGIQRP